MDKKYLYVAGGAAALLGLLLVSRASASAAPLAKGSKILLLGDSLAVGLSTELKRLAEAGGYSFSSSAQTGTRSDQWEGRIAPLLASEAPSLVLVSLGTNDAALGSAAPQQDAHIGNVASLISSSAPLVWLAPPPLPPRLNDGPVRDSIARYAANVIDGRAFTFPQGSRANDGIHFSPQGYASWADQIWQTLLQQGAISP